MKNHAANPLVALIASLIFLAALIIVNEGNPAIASEAGDRQLGDANGDLVVDISDVVYDIEYIFGGGPAPVDPILADITQDGSIDISDAVGLIDYIFGSVPPPVITNCPIYHLKVLVLNTVTRDCDATAIPPCGTVAWSVSIAAGPIPQGPYSIDPATGLFSYTARMQDSGEMFAFRVVVTDNCGKADSCSIFVELLAKSAE